MFTSRAYPLVFSKAEKIIQDVLPERIIAFHLGSGISMGNVFFWTNICFLLDSIK